MKGYSLTVHNNKFCVQFRISGQGQKTRSTGFAAVEGNRHKAEKKAREIYVACLKEAEAGIIDCNTLLCDYIKDYLERRHSDFAPSTYFVNTGYLNKHIYPYFKKTGLKLKEVKPRHIEKYCSDKRESGVSNDAILKHIRLISPALKDAVKNGYLTSNPCEYANKPKRAGEKPAKDNHVSRAATHLLVSAGAKRCVNESCTRVCKTRQLQHNRRHLLTS